MDNKNYIMSIGKMKELTDRLSSIKHINQHDRNEHIEAEHLSHGLLDLEESFHKVIEELLPRLDINSTDDQLEELLTEIAVELAHINYHITDSEYLSRYIIPKE